MMFARRILAPLFLMITKPNASERDLSSSPPWAEASVSSQGIQSSPATYSHIENAEINNDPSHYVLGEAQMRNSFGHISEYSYPHAGSRRKHISYAKRGRIIGGDEIVENRYPWLATIFSKNTKSRTIAQLCGGSLIAPNVVLSAAHCSKSVNHIHLGRHDLNDHGDYYEIFDIVEKAVHPDFDAKTYDNDFALFKISGESIFQTVQLNKYENEPENDAMLDVIGWGMTKSDRTNPSSIPLEARVQYIEGKRCEKKYDDKLISENMMCAAGDGNDACQGDSGGPLIIKGDDASKDTVVGIVSWGLGCARKDYPGVYARVSVAIDWIEETTAALTAVEPTSTQPTVIPTTQVPTHPPTSYPTHDPTTSTPTAPPPTSYPTYDPTTSTPTAEPSHKSTSVQTLEPSRKPPHDSGNHSQPPSRDPLMIKKYPPKPAKLHDNENFAIVDIDTWSYPGKHPLSDTEKNHPPKPGNLFFTNIEMSRPTKEKKYPPKSTDFIHGIKAMSSHGRLVSSNSSVRLADATATKVSQLAALFLLIQLQIRW